MIDPNSNAANPFPGETNPLPMKGSEYHGQFSRKRSVLWTKPGLRVTRLRLLSDPGFPWWDVSYCHGQYEEDGETVNCHVILPFSQLPKRGFRGAIVKAAIADGVNAKKMGALDAISTLC